MVKPALFQCAGVQYHEDLRTIHAHIIRQPVKQMRMGWEVADLWADTIDPASPTDNEVIQLQWGTWFFF